MLLPRSGPQLHRIWLCNDLQRAHRHLSDLTRQLPALLCPADLCAFELRLQQAQQRWHACLTALVLHDALQEPLLRQAVKKLLASSPKRFTNQGLRPVTLHCAHGPAVTLHVAYYTRGKGPAAGVPKGFFPALVVLGIHDRVTPTLASHIGQLVALSSSFQEAHAWLRQRGCPLCPNTLRRLCYRYARRVRLGQQAQQAASQTVGQAVGQAEGQAEGQDLTGRLLVIACDGGRLRLRKDRKAKTKKGRKRYSTCWREPKMLILYTVKQVDGQARLDHSIPVVLDGTLSGPDSLFALLRYHLGRLRVTQAERVLLVADAAAWIWKRAKALWRDLGVAAERRHELVDFYHASEHLGKAAEAAGTFTGKSKKRWLRQQQGRLLSGQVEAVLSTLEKLAEGQPTNKTLAKEVAYFVRHGRQRQRLDYGKIKGLGLPVGSGAIESAVRRVINLRLKGASIFWHKDSAEAVLLLRCAAKAGRFQELDRLAFRIAIPEAA